MSPYSKITTYFTLVTLILALTSCDFLSADGNSPYVEPEFSVTNDVTNRLTLYDDTGSIESKAKPSRGIESELSVAATVSPPVINTETTRASHLDYDGEYIHVGYKTFGTNYGGGVDIFSADGVLEESNRSFQGGDFDVQEVVYDNKENAIYIAGAVKGKIAGDFKAQLLKLDAETAGLQVSASTEGNLVKSIDRTDSYIYAVSDQNHIYRFDKGLINSDLIENENSVGYRSILARNFKNSEEVFTLDLEGTVRGVSDSFNDDFTFETKLIDNSESLKDNTIARLSFFSRTNKNGNGFGNNFLVSALNEFGFSIVDKKGDIAWKSNAISKIQSRHYTTVTTFTPSEGPSGSTYIYAGASDFEGNYIDIFEVTNGFKGKGVTLQASYNLDDLINEHPEISSTNGQINHIVATERRLYVAKGTDGLVIFDLE